MITLATVLAALLIVALPSLPSLIGRARNGPRTVAPESTGDSATRAFALQLFPPS